MSKKTWVLRMKEEVSSSEYDGRPYYFCDDEANEFLTKTIHRAALVYDKEKIIKMMKAYDEIIIKKNLGNNEIRNHGWENISKRFDFVEVEIHKK